MAKVKKFDTEVDEVTNSSNPEVAKHVVPSNAPIAELDANFQRDDLNSLVAKLNEVIRKIN